MLGNVAQIVGPISQLRQNTKYYSGKAPKRIKRPPGELPHVTIQCPVYKEGLRSVIEPTIRSVKEAISTYEMQGGTANVFVNDDGMQIISPRGRARPAGVLRQEEHNIGWVARPRHNPKPSEGETLFVRRGKFKKASNMNYALWVSQRVEERLIEVARTADWTADDEAREYQTALAAVAGEDEGPHVGRGQRAHGRLHPHHRLGHARAQGLPGWTPSAARGASRARRWPSCSTRRAS